MRIEIVDGLRTRELRRAVLRPGWAVGTPMHGDDNPDAVHLAAVEDDGTVVAACLILPRAYPLRPGTAGAWQLRGMATTPPRQGEGIGGRLLAAAMDEARRRDGLLIWCDARTAAVPFYRTHGFVPEGEQFLHAESGIPHHRMCRPL